MVTYVVCVRVLVCMYTESFQVLYFPSHFRGCLAFASGTGGLFRMQWYWSLKIKPVSENIFIVHPRKRKCFREIYSFVKRGSSFLFFGSYCFIILIKQSLTFAQSDNCQLQFLCGVERARVCKGLEPPSLPHRRRKVTDTVFSSSTVFCGRVVRATSCKNCLSSSFCPFLSTDSSILN